MNHTVNVKCPILTASNQSRSHGSDTRVLGLRSGFNLTVSGDFSAKLEHELWWFKEVL